MKGYCHSHRRQVNSNIQEFKFRTWCSWKNLISCRHCNLKQQVTTPRPLREGRTCQGTAQSAAKRAAASSYMKFSSGYYNHWCYPLPRKERSSSNLPHPHLQHVHLRTKGSRVIFCLVAWVSKEFLVFALETFPSEKRSWVCCPRRDW